MCNTSLPRRLFLSASVMAMASAACNMPLKPPGTPKPSPVPIPQGTQPTTLTPNPTHGATSFITKALPDLAGLAVDLTDNTLNLRAISGEATYTLSPNAIILGADGAPAGLDRLAVGESVALWLDGDQQAGLVQVLGDLGTLGVTLNAPSQPEPTGETRTVGALTMITRAGWGAADPDMDASGEHGLFDAEENTEGWLIYPAPLADALNTIVVHHTALDLTAGPREIQRSHQGAKGYADIAYHYLIDSFGALYEGRTLSARGSHTRGFNTGSIGIALLGNFEVMTVPRQVLNTLVTLIAYLQTEYTITHLAGHRDFNPDDTECPGETLEALLPLIADELHMGFGAGGYVVPSWQITPTPDSG